jgi:glycogen debranching enzyme
LGDIIRFQDKFYVLASSPLADDRTRVLKYGETFGVFNRYGDIEMVGQGQLGIFYVETRHLSRMTLRFDRQTPLLLASTVRDDNAFLSVDLTNFATGTQSDIPRGTVHLYRSKFLDEGICYEQFRLTNYGLTPVEFSLSFEFGADFADIFEVRGTERHQKGRLQSTRVESDKVALNYLGLDSVFRSTCVNFSPAPAALSDSSASYDVRLASREESTISVTVVCERSSAARHTLPYKEALTARNAQCQEELFGRCKIRTSSKPFNAWLARAEADLRMLIQGNPEGAYPYAGVPWFNTVFGRDGIITAMEWNACGCIPGSPRAC